MLADTDAGDTLAEAKALGRLADAPLVACDAIQSNVDVDIFAFDVAEARRITIRCDPTAGEDDFSDLTGSPFLRLFKADGKPEELQRTDEGLLQDLILKAGRYFVGVSAASNKLYDPLLAARHDVKVLELAYKLTVEDASPKDPAVFAGRIGPCQPQLEREFPFFSEPTFLDVSVSAAAGSALRPSIRLTDDAGSLIAAATAPVAGGQGVRVQQILKAGKYKIAVASADGSAGEFIGRIDASARVNPSDGLRSDPGNPESNPRTCVVADVNNDGFDDIVVAAAGKGTPLRVDSSTPESTFLSIFLGTKDRSFLPPTRVSFKGGNHPGTASSLVVLDRPAIAPGATGSASPWRTIAVAGVRARSEPNQAPTLETMLTLVTIAGPVTRTVVTPVFPADARSSVLDAPAQKVALSAVVRSTGTIEIGIASGGNAAIVEITPTSTGFAAEQRPLSLPQMDLKAIISGLAFGDIDGDGRSDLVMTDQARSQVLVFLRGQDGIIQNTSSVSLQVGTAPVAVACNDLDADGRVEIVTANFLDFPTAEAGIGQVTVCRNRRGKFDVQNFDVAGGGPSALVIVDVDNDKKPDIVTANQLTNDVSVLLNRPGNSFVTSPASYAGLACGGIAAADFDGDGLKDVVVVDYLPPLFVKNELVPYPDRRIADVAVLYGRGDGTFNSPYARTTAGAAPVAVAEGDVNGDGRSDIAVANIGSSDVSVLLGRGDGTFTTESRVKLPVVSSASGTLARTQPVKIALADVNGDGRQDIVVACRELELGSDERLQGSLTVVPSGTERASRLLTYLGFGTGTFENTPARDIPLATDPQVVIAADLDGTGAVSIVTAEAGDGAGGQLTIVATAGETTVKRYPLPGRLPTAITSGVVAGRPVLVVATVPRERPEESNGSLLILERDPGSPTGFRERKLPGSIGVKPRGVRLADVDGDGHPDVVTVAQQSELVTIFWGGGETPFFQCQTIDVGAEPANNQKHRVAPVSVDVITVGGRAAVATANQGSSDIRVFVQDRSSPRNFSKGKPIPIFDGASAATVGDFDGDGRPDLAIPDGRNGVSIVLAGGNGLLPVFGSSVSNTPAARVEQADLNKAASADTVTLDRGGNLTIRYDGAATTHGVRFEGPRSGPSPGQNPGTGGKAFDATVLRNRSMPPRVAAIDYGRQALFIGAPAADGDVVVQQTLRARTPAQPAAAPPMLSRIARALEHDGDLNGDGYGDLVVSNPGAGSIDILLSGPAGVFDDSRWQSLDVGAGPIGVLLTDIDGDGAADLLSANQVSGDVSVRLGVPGIVGTSVFSAASGFGPEFRYRTSSRVYGYDIDSFSGRGSAIAPCKLSDIALGDVNGDRIVDLVATSSDDRSFTILLGVAGKDGRWAGFAGPERHVARAPITPEPVVATEAAEVRDVALGDFDRDGRADIALLDLAKERIIVLLSDGKAASTAVPQSIALTNVIPRSLQVADVTGPSGVPDGVPDLVVGNDFGDVLALQGLGNGRFEPPRSSRFSIVRADRSVALLAADMDGDGREDFVYANKKLDRIDVAPDVTRESFTADQKQGLLAPSAMATVDETVGGRKMKNLVIANGGGNQILVFRNAAVDGGAAGAFLPPEPFFVGTNPSALAVGDVNRDGIPDVVVANEGSDDISVMLGTRNAAGRWSLKAGPRLAANGKTPVGIAVGDFVTATGARGTDGLPDIAVTNRGSKSANIIAGLSGGFFNDSGSIPLVLPPNGGGGPILTAPDRIFIGNSALGSFTAFNTKSPGQSGAIFESFSSRPTGGGSVSLAVATQGGTTFLALGNQATGSVSQFLARPGSIDFKLDRSKALLDVTGLAYNGRGLFGASPSSSRSEALELFAFTGRDPAAAAANAQVNALRSAVQFVVSRTSAVALIATVASVRVAAMATAAEKAADKAQGEETASDSADGGSEAAEAEKDAAADKGIEPGKPAAGGKDVNEAINKAVADSPLLDGFFGGRAAAEKALAASAAELLRAVITAERAGAPAAGGQVGGGETAVPAPAGAKATPAQEPAPARPTDARARPQPPNPAAVDPGRTDTQPPRAEPASGARVRAAAWSAWAVRGHGTASPRVFGWLVSRPASGARRRRRPRPAR